MPDDRSDSPASTSSAVESPGGPLEADGGGVSPRDLAHLVLDNLSEGCQVVGPDFRYLYVNRATAAHGRTTKEQLLGRTMMEVYPGIEQTEMFGVLRRCLVERSPLQMENEFTFPDGSRAWFELRFEPVPAGVAVLSLEIDARKRAEAALRRANRALAVLSECNQILVRAADERQFMNDVCRVVVERGGYRLAWIGLLDGGDPTSVQPVARAGRDDGYVDRARVSAGDDERGAGPAGRAIREGKTAVVRSIATDPSFAPWRQAALERGFASIIALPIRAGDALIGSMNIYAAEPGAFDDAERELLEEMALDLGHGIATLRARVAREQAEARVGHLNAVLRGIRGVNRLITRERDPQALIQGACQLLVESRGFFTSCIVLSDGANVQASAEAGDGVRLAGWRRMLSQGHLPECVVRTTRQGGLFVRRDPARSCPDCPLNLDYPDLQDVAAVPLECEGRRFGALVVSLRAGMADPEELELLREVAGDVAFALRGIELQEEGEKTGLALAESQTRYRELVANLEDVVFSTDAEGRVRFMSPAAERLYGFRPEDVVGRHFSQFVHPDDVSALASSFARTLDGVGEPHEFRILDQSGRVRHLRSSSRPRREAGRTVGVDGVMIDFTERKRAQEALQESERRYRSLFDNSAVAIAHCRMVYDGDRPVDFVYLDVNPAFEALTGLKDVVGKAVTQVIPGILESDPRLFEIYGGAARSGTATRFEIHLDALQQWYDVSVYSPKRDHFVAVFDVVTGRKRAEENLVRFSERLERLARVVQDLSQARGVEAVIDVVRRAGRALVGADGATFVLRDGDLCHYVDEDAIEPLWKGRRFPMSACISGWSMSHRQAVAIEDVYADDRIPHDAYRPTFVRSLAVVPIRCTDPIGAIGAYWANFHSATDEELRLLQALADSTSVALENLRVLRELEDARARTRALYDHLPNPLFVWRWEGDRFVLADFNDAARTVSKGGVAGFVGKTPAELGHAVPGLADDLERCLRDRAPIRREVDCILAPGKPSHRLVLTYGFVPSDMVVLHAEDVTRHRLVEEQLSISQRLDAVGRLAGGIAHDFNNLLSIIISYAGFAVDELRESDPIRADLVEVQNAGRRAATLTKQLLAFSRKQVFEPEVLSLNEVVSGIEGMLRRLLGEDVEIIVRPEAGLGSVTADRAQLEQVIMNLAVNSRDAMPNGGRLTFETRNVEIDEHYVEQGVVVAPGPFVLLAVSDTGCGMDAVTRERVFEPFFTTKDKGKGTGLGLSTAYGIVKQSGGYLWVYSELGQGTTFKVYLPRVDAAAAPPAPEAPRATRGGGETVLVVEDEDAVRRLIERILRAAGYRVLAAANGGEALLLGEKHAGEIRLVVTDVVMPHMGGREVADRLTRLVPGLKVLFTSGYTDDAIVHHGVLDPGTHFVTKPVSAADLTRKVRELLDARG